MGVRINTNIEAINAQRNLSVTAGVFAKSVEKLSSGLRINRAGDDAAGLTISEKLRGQVKGLNQAARNAQDAISLIQTAEGALNESHGILQRMRELAVQAANDTLTTEDRQAIGSELDALVAEITRISTDTEFNTQKLLNGSVSAFTFQIGANANQSISITVSSASAGAIGVSGAVGTFTATSGQTVANANALITAVDNAIKSISTNRSGLGAVQNRLEHTILNLQVAAENLAASESRIRDTDLAAETVNFTKTQILQQAGTAILAQANQSPNAVLSLLR